MKALDAEAVKQMQGDIQKFGTGHDKAVQAYKMNLQILWSAMEQPYCGYGAYGLTAVKKSFGKSVDHVRTEFMSAVKV